MDGPHRDTGLHLKTDLGLLCSSGCPVNIDLGSLASGFCSSILFRAGHSTWTHIVWQHMILGNLTVYKLACVQELNDRRLTLAEGSCLSERDLVRTQAHSAAAILLLADRFSPSAHQEDLGLQFQVRYCPLLLKRPRFIKNGSKGLNTGIPPWALRCTYTLEGQGSRAFSVQSRQQACTCSQIPCT